MTTPKSFGIWFGELNAEYEAPHGVTLEAYRDSNGVPTGPWGVITNLDGSPVRMGQTWTMDQALLLYGRTKQKFASALHNMLSPLPLTQMQFDGIGVLAWNIGLEAFRRSSANEAIQRQRYEEAAEAFYLWNGDTIKGGKPGPDGKPARRPDGSEMAVGEEWFKRFDGIARRNVSAALLFLGYDWRKAAAYRKVTMAVDTKEISPGRWYDFIERQTPWEDILAEARQDPLAERHEDEITKDLNLGELKKIGGDPEQVIINEQPAPVRREPPEPFREYDPMAKPKPVALSRRVYGLFGIFIGWVTMMAQAIAEMPFVSQLATMSPLQVQEWWMGMLILMAGLLLYWYGQVRAKGPLK